MLVRAGLAVLVGLAWAWILWSWGDMPHATEYQDDGLYLIGAKSLATGQGYKILNLPGQPAQTKYPPGFPAWLAAAWWLGGDFPGNLRWATALCVVWLPVMTALLWIWLGRAGITGWWRDGLTALVLLNPYIVLFSISMFTEVSFTALVLGAWLLLERGRPGWAGGLAGVAYLWRTAGIAMLPAGILWMLWRGDRRGAGRFAVAMLPAVVGWMVWARLHMPPGDDIVTLYYTNYIGYHLLNFRLGEAHLFLWKNLDGLMQGLGSYMMPKAGGGLGEKILAEVMAVAGLSGLWRVVREGNETVRGYAWFGLFYAGQLVVWHFAPNERFVLPLLPLLLVGWTAEFGRLGRRMAELMRGTDAGQRRAAWVLSGIGLLVVGVVVQAQATVLTALLPEFMEGHRREWRRLAPAFAALRGSSEPVLTEDDTLLYLATGRPSVSLLVPTLNWYREDWEARRAAFRDAAGYARQQGIRWFLLRESDFSRDMDPEMHRRLRTELRGDAAWERVENWDGVELYRLRGGR
jgi:hypothetical protein